MYCPAHNTDRAKKSLKFEYEAMFTGNAFTETNLAEPTVFTAAK